MPKNKRPRFIDSFKPRYDRSNVRVKNAEDVIITKPIGPIVEDKGTKWKKISEKTFNELIEKDALTDEQIIEHIKREQEAAQEKKLLKAKEKIRNHSDFKLIVELASIDVTDAANFRKVTKLLKGKSNKSELLKEAEKLRGK